MGFRPPERVRDWVLLFSPAAMMLLATFAGMAFEKRGNEEAVLMYALLAACLAAPLCIVMGFVFTKPNPRWHVRAAWILLAALAVAFLNYSIAIGGCVLVVAR
jgi:uncharacterized membrane protein